MTKTNEENQEFPENQELPEIQDYSKIFTEGSKPVSEHRASDEPESDKEIKDLAPEEQDAATKKLNKDKQTQDDTGDKSEDQKESAEHLKKRLEESRAWGHKKNMAYVNAKKKVNEYLHKLAEDGTLAEEDKATILEIFNSKDIEEDSPESSNKTNPFVELKGKLDKEFSVFKKYAKIEEADEKYNSFFYFWPLMDNQEQEETLTYFEEESPEVALDKIMSVGSDLYENLFKGMSTKGGIIPYIKSLSSENKKLTEKLNKLESELDSTAGKIYNRSISSKVSNLQNPGSDKSYSDIWKNG